MKKLVHYGSILLLLSLLFCCCSMAQMPDYVSLKEKIYMQTNHVFFRPGEQLFFKLYVVKAKDQTPSFMSGNAYVEIINPAGSVVQKLNYKVDDGYAEGSYDFGDEATGGIYKLRAYTTWMRNERDSTFFTKEITVQKTIAPRVLMKLDFPMKGYGAGDEVTADFSARNLADLPIRNYEATYTVSIGGKAVQVNRFKTNADGKAKLVFRLPATLFTNDGLLNITFVYDAYTESVSRSIPIVLNKIDLQFMPEGGTLVTGIATNIAFKALNENGKPADIKGEVWDDKGVKVAAFESYHSGMGKFLFTPQAGKKYTAKITSPANIAAAYSLPAAQSEGVVMNMVKKENQLQVKLMATKALQVKLIGQTKSQVYFSEAISLQKGTQTITINTQKFPAGIAQFTVYQSNAIPLAERLVFLNERNVVNVKITTDKGKYGPREKVTMHIKTTDDGGKPIPSNLSLSVVDDKLWTMADDKQDHIFSWLLMGSELSGKIDEPQFYFKKEEPKALPALDLVMLTNGYRYFDFVEYVQQNKKLQFSPEQSNTVGGVILNGKGQPVKATVYLADTYNSHKAIRMETDNNGQFFFSGLAPNTYYQVIARSHLKKEKVTIRVEQNSMGYYSPFAKKDTVLLFNEKELPVGNAAFLRKNVQKDAFQNEIAMPPNELFLGKAEANLDEVVVVGFGAQKRRDMTGAVAVVEEKGMNGVDNVNNMLAGRVAGLNVQREANPGAAPRVQIRGIGAMDAEPLVVMNGVPVENWMNIAPANIENITVLKDAAATAIYGSRAANGVIIIESKKGRFDKNNISLAKEYYYASQSIRSGGTVYAVARKFYAPQYSTTQTAERTDFRETIYWNPVVQTDKDGNATVSFYNSDAATTFRAVAEGIGFNGKIGRAEMTYAAQPLLGIDAKIPPYLTVGDRALLPLFIKNNRDENLRIHIGLQLPQHMKAGAFTDSITIEADSSMRLLIPVEATAAVNGNIRFVIRSKGGTETLVLPITASDKGFPVIHTISGNTSAQHSFTVSKMVPGSMHSSLKLFRSLEGQLLDGIESMLREPGGCFEQTSSSTYPNIYVLKYLRESGKSNPEIERKALGYIERGYKRLIGFETAQNGFEWFGHTPPHEALTAYGLLEFTDMQEFINVDRQMLARTKAFLLSRRDGMGGFQLASGGYDRFASVPGKIANIYIVYALTQAGIGAEILPEYKAAFAKAVQSNDGYQMAMMALAASNLKEEKDFEQIMQLLHQSYSKSVLASETSVVNSRDASLKVEALSLYAMALAREKKPQAGVMAEVVSRILAEKSYYGYGSTQATVLALNAVVCYSKVVGEVSRNANVQFAVNRQPVSSGDSIRNVGEGENVFAVRYDNEEQTVPYNMEIGYHTFTPPNSPKAEIHIATSLRNSRPKTGETVRMEIAVTNTQNRLQPMAIAKIGIPAGLSLQPWQLKEIGEKHQVAYYEMFDNYLVLYWMGFAEGETKKINLDLKAEIGGTYVGKASTAYLYYTPEHKHWNDGLKVEVLP